jgi:18S rRNA (adenine1779-N6/adenine1780-N6)-dimethyltransferase
MITKSVMTLLEDNRRTLQSLQPDKIIDDSRSIQTVVEEILEREPWKGQRASKMDLDDFLQLLQEFNEAGIHFS